MRHSYLPACFVQPARAQGTVKPFLVSRHQPSPLDEAYQALYIKTQDLTRAPTKAYQAFSTFDVLPELNLRLSFLTCTVQLIKRFYIIYDTS